MNNYFENPSLSRTDLKNILTSPKYYHSLSTGAIKPKETASMDMGTCIHMALLEPDKFIKEYQPLEVVSIPDELVKQIKGQCRWELIDQYEGHSFFAEPESEASLALMQERLQPLYKDKKIILPSQWNKIHSMINGLNNNPIVCENLEGEIKTEQEFYGELDGIPVKCKADIINETKSLIIDFKTTDKAIAPKSFSWQVGQYALDIQAYLYREIFRQNNLDYSFKFLLQNKQSYEAIVLNPSDAIFEQGERRAKLAIGIYKFCMEHNSWADYLDQFGNSNSSAEFELDLPKGGTE